MSNDEPKITVGNDKIGFCGLLFIVLLILKVGVVETNVMTWSWWWITCPLWVPIAILLMILTIVLLIHLSFKISEAIVPLPSNKELLVASFPTTQKEKRTMCVDSFNLMLFKDADEKLQQRYPDALWFAIATKGISGNSFEQLEAALIKIRRGYGISFTPQNKEFNGQLVWVGKESPFGELV